MHKYVLICVAFAAACGKSSASSKNAAPSASGPPAAAAPSASGPQDRCEIHVRGDATIDASPSVAHNDVTANRGKVMAGTDYWMTDAELRMALKTMAGVMSKKSDAEIASEVDADMKKDPRLFLLLVNCSNDDVHVNLVPDNASHYADVPFAPKKYALLGKDAKAGDFHALFGIETGKPTSFLVSEPGTLELTKFDKTGIAGTFHFVAKNIKGDKTVTVDGKFDYGCRGTICTK